MKKTIELSELQLKVIKELDVLTDAFVSTFNEIGKIIKEYSEEISIPIEKFIKERSEWRLYDSQSFDLSFMPFRNDYSYEKKFSINTLKQYFVVGGQKTLVKEMKIEGKKKQLDYLLLDWGFNYDIEEDPFKFFYVQITKNKSPDGAVFSVEEYEKLANEIKSSIGIHEDYFYDSDHPDNGDSESFTVWLDFKYFNELSKFFKICKEELIEKFISKIKD